METGAPHRPVLYQEIIQYLAPFSPGRYLDCTAGAGGHAKGILEASAPDGELVTLDVDPDAVVLARATLAPFGSRAIIKHASYTESAQILAEIGWQKVDGIVLDLGVSSMQLDTAERGFSFRLDGPLDMRFDPTSGLSAADLVNGLEEKELADLIWRYGEERYSHKIARAIVQARPLHTTQELAAVVRAAIGRSGEKQDPATRTFQALRIAVNDELENIETALPQLIELLKPHARLAVISFHSLEDRIVKQIFQRESKDCICSPEQPICTCGHHASIEIITPHPVVPQEEEKARNPRSRSAKLRVAQKL
ncbi:MAG TPA: 16S rRNA (cytosine(1402)-N(4))-methyltransferase [Anaerolineaceae bacterium]|nr:MAG: Ribosomal RNA small subunit methyltransferase H [Anaerolineae bacterium 49_20]HAE85778.1 16S rRNA (cytosine(1402)-N(4))-methyltransferase [Anaerolineaceae bacterium]